MIYSTRGINKLIKEERLVIKPNPQTKKAFIKVHFSEKISLNPKEFRISKSKESVKLPNNIAAFYDGYTHLARRGIITHLGSMFVYPGTNGQITFEIFNASENVVKIRKGERAGQLILLSVG